MVLTNVSSRPLFGICTTSAHSKTTFTSQLEGSVLLVFPSPTKPLRSYDLSLDCRTLQAGENVQENLSLWQRSLVSLVEQVTSEEGPRRIGSPVNKHRRGLIQAKSRILGQFCPTFCVTVSALWTFPVLPSLLMGFVSGDVVDRWSHKERTFEFGAGSFSRQLLHNSSGRSGVCQVSFLVVSAVFVAKLEPRVCLASHKSYSALVSEGSPSAGLSRRACCFRHTSRCSLSLCS